MVYLLIGERIDQKIDEKDTKGYDNKQIIDISNASDK